MFAGGEGGDDYIEVREAVGRPFDPEERREEEQRPAQKGEGTHPAVGSMLRHREPRIVTTLNSITGREGSSMKPRPPGRTLADELVAVDVEANFEVAVSQQPGRRG